ncbi:MAG: DUF2513 domain-containing protein [Verrucomicrobiota bacterium]
MTRDPQLIRALLIYTEAHQDGNQPLEIPAYQDLATWLPTYSPPEGVDMPSVTNFILGHMQLMIDADLAAGTVYVDKTGWPGVTVVGRMPEPWFDKLTPDGYDLLAAMRNESVWRTVMEKIASAGGSFTMAALKSVSSKALSDLLTSSSNGG